MLWRRFGRRESLFSFLGPGTFYLTLAFGIGYFFWPYFYYIKNEHLIVIGLFALWRYSWLLVNYIRSLIYHFRIYPRLRAKAKEVWNNFPSASPDRIYFVIPSYHEAPWVTYEMLQNLLSELSTLPCSATVVIATGSDEEDLLIANIFEVHPVSKKVELVLQRQKHGKRIAMGDALRAVARRYYKGEEDYNSVTVLMDGDSVMAPGTLQKVLSFFVAFPNLGALTTNEVAYINSPSRWYRDWFNMKFGQRHVMFGSHALSRRVLTLTGRFSAFRTAIVVRKEFIERIENDYLEHSLFGRFRFLMGDDKSTWFYLLREGWDMFYIPDCLCYSLESRRENFLSISLQLLFRWYGNTLRNNRRALALGPKRVGGLFVWLAILDQKISMWTGLVGPISALALSLAIDPVYFPIYIAWVFLIRTVQMGIIALGGHPVTYRTVPLMLYNQWAGALIKIWVNFHLAHQKWTKGKAYQEASRWWIRIPHPLAPVMPNFVMLVSVVIFLWSILVSEKILNLPDLHAFSPVKKETSVIEAIKFGVVPNDGRDDSETLARLIKEAPLGAEIQLPAGTLDLRAPLVIRRSGIALVGLDKGRTVLHGQGLRTGEAVILFEGRSRNLPIRLKETARAGNSFLKIEKVPSRLKSGSLILLRRPNDSDFLKKIGSRCWQKSKPYIRQEIFQIIKLHKNHLFLDRPLTFDYPPKETEIRLILPAENVVLRNLTVSYEVTGGSKSPPKHIYRNLFPEKAVDLLRLEYTARVTLENLELLNAGRHALNLDKVYDVRVRKVRVAGAWNKGKGGYGYVRLARAFMCQLEDLEVTGIRHLTIQWSSSHNLLRRIYTEVDLNFHGGYPHHNLVTGVIFNIPREHPWKGVIYIPRDACFAPPNGPENRVIGITFLSPRPRKPQAPPGPPGKP